MWLVWHIHLPSSTTSRVDPTSSRHAQPRSQRVHLAAPQLLSQVRKGRLSLVNTHLASLSYASDAELEQIVPTGPDQAKASALLENLYA